MSSIPQQPVTASENCSCQTCTSASTLAALTCSTLATCSTFQTLQAQVNAITYTGTLPISVTAPNISLNYTSNFTLNGGNLDLSSSGVVAGSYGSGTAIPTFTVDQFGRLSAAGSVAITFPSSPVIAKGDLYTFSTVGARLPVGTDGYFLVASSAQTTGLLWQALTSLQVTTALGFTPLQNAITSLNGLTVATQLFAYAQLGLAPSFVSTSNTHTLQIPLAASAGVNAGLISNTDYTNFNSKASGFTVSNPITLISTVLGLNYGSTLTLTAGALGLSNSGVTIGTYGSSTQSAQITVDVYGRITAAANLAISTGAGSPLTSKGDIYTYSSTNARLAVGANSTFLIADSTQLTGLNWHVLSSTDITSALGFTPISAAVQNLNGLTVGTQTFAIGTAGLSPAFSSVSPVHTLNIPLASTASVTAGLLSNADYATFTGKQNAISANAPLSYNAGTYVISLSTSGVTAATYGSATQSAVIAIDAYGRITSASNVSISGGVSPLTTKGDIFTFSTVSARLPVGTDGFFLIAASGQTTGLLWQALTSGQVTTALGFTPLSAAITTLNTLTAATQTFAIGTAGTSPAFNSVTATHTLNIPLASTATVTAGLLSNADYTTFNNKQATVSATLPITIVSNTVALNISSNFVVLSSNLQLSTTGVSAATYGSATQSAVIAVDAYGRITTASNVTITAGTSSPLTTKGDVYTFSTVNSRLPVGTDGYVLTAASGQTTGLIWQQLNTSNVVEGTNLYYTSARVSAAFAATTAGGDLTGTYPNPSIAVSAVTNGKMAQMATLTAKANVTGSPASPADVTVVDLYNSTQKTTQSTVSTINEMFVGATFSNAQGVTVTNTVTETSLLGTAQTGFTKVYPANYFVANKTVRCKILGQISTAVSAPTLRIRVTLVNGGTTVTVMDTTAQTLLGTSLASRNFEIDFDLWCVTGGSTGKVDGVGGFLYGNAAANVMGTYVEADLASGGQQTINWTLPWTIDVLATWGTASTSNTLVVKDSNLITVA